MKLCAVVAFALTSLASFARGQTPQPYCTAGISSSLCTAQITANRQPNVAIDAGCVISVSGVPGNRQGLVFYGIDNTGFTPTSWSAQSSSFLCVKAPIQRLGATQNSGGTVGQCNGSYVIDWDAFQNANPFALGNPWVAGDEVFVQSWYRDPTAVTASNLSNAVQLTLRPSVSVPCVTPLPGMVTIPAGTFTMGSDAPGGAPYFNTLGMQPAHQVTLTYCFWMGATEVTQAQYSALMGANPSAWVGANNPVERVNWFAALNYCHMLTLQQAALIPPGYEYRLPTEAEWEYACRAGSTTEFNVGADLFCNQANISFSYHSNSNCNATAPTPVASYAPNAWGLYDMHGNVREWCLDSNGVYTAGSVTDPFVTGDPNRIARGGWWAFPSSFSRSASRSSAEWGESDQFLGFRVVLAPVRSW